MNITVIGFGTRGDVQPFLALALALRERGHTVTFAAPSDFEAQFKAYDIPYARIPFSMKSVLELEISKRVMRQGITPLTLLAVLRGAMPELNHLLDATLNTMTEITHSTDLLIVHGLLMPFAHAIQQHRHIPLMLCTALPIMPTQAFPNPLFPQLPFGQRFYNPLTFDWLLRAMFAFTMKPMSIYRRSVGLPALSLGNVMHTFFSGQIPMVMHYSPHLLPVPPDWGKHVHVTGTWALPTLTEWTPPDKLGAFLAHGEPPVFLGFGSMTVPNPAQIAETISEALRLANLRGVLQAGWGGLTHEDEHLITIGEAPHDWLFPRMAAIVHHGGSGTTHAALQAGKPALVVPFIADQPFWGRRIAELRVGVPPIAPKKLTPERLAAALRTLTQDSAMQQRAADLGALLRAEDGLGAACDLVEQYTSSRAT